MQSQKRWWQYRPGQLGRNAMYGTAGLGIRTVIQAVYLLVVSRWLGAEGYGLFAGSIALATLLAPVSSWGVLMLLTRYISRDRKASGAMWATALWQTSILGSVLVVGMLFVSAFLPEKLPAMPLSMLAASELILLPITWAAASQCQALEQGKGTAIAICLIPIGRTVCMLIAIGIGSAATPANAVAAHFVGSVAAGIAAVILVAYIDSWPRWKSRLKLATSMKEGGPYIISSVASGYQDVDKFLMLQILGAAAAGHYTLAFRIASIFVMPVTALVSAGMPRLMMQAGTKLGAKTYRAVLLSGIGYGILAGLAILLCAPWIPNIFGSDYATVTHYLMILSAWPILFAVRHGLATHLTAHDRQTIRAYIEIAAVISVVALNLWLLPRIGPEAAALSLLATEVMAASAIGIAIKRRKYQFKNTSDEHSDV